MRLVLFLRHETHNRCLGHGEADAEAYGIRRVFVVRRHESAITLRMDIEHVLSGVPDLRQIITHHRQCVGNRVAGARSVERVYERRIIVPRQNAGNEADLLPKNVTV